MVRALILALARFKIVSKDQTRALEREWAGGRDPRANLQLRSPSPNHVPQADLSISIPQATQLWDCGRLTQHLASVLQSVPGIG